MIDNVSEARVATYLYRLARWCFRRRRTVLGLWLGLLVLTGVAAGTLGGEPDDSFEIPGTESLEAIDLVEQRFPDVSIGESARVVFAAPDGEHLVEPRYRAAIEDAVTALATAPGVTGVAAPFEVGTVSPAGTVAYAEVEYGPDPPDGVYEDLAEAVSPARDAGLTVEMSAPFEEAEELVSGVELVGLAVAAVVLILTFGSLVAAGLPLLNALIGVGLTVLGIMAAGAFLDLSSSTPTLALMLGLAVAIDYALFILSRYRHELAVTGHAGEAAGRAMGTAGSAVVFAGLITIIAMCGLWIVGVPLIAEMGFAAAVAVAVAIVVALTLLPAVCGFAGNRLRPGREVLGSRARDPESDLAGLGHRWASFVTRRRVPVLVVVVLGMVVVAIPALDLRLALPDDGMAPPESTQRQAYDLVSDGFGPGHNGPLLVVVDATGSADPAGAAEQVAAAVARLDGVAEVTPPAFNPAGDTALVQVVSEAAPVAEQTERLVVDIRDRIVDIEHATGATVAVTGLTAVLIDFTTKLRDALVPFLVLVAGLSFLLLMLVFRSILIPLKAAFGFLLTIGATFGAVVAVFQWGWLSNVFGVAETGPVISHLPIFVIAVVFGLAMDYQIFLVTRMREEHVHGAASTPAVVTGFHHGGRVVTAAALIMISVFAGFMLSGDDLVKQIGFALAVAIVFDAFVVRMTLVPAVMALLGRTAWWLPAWLSRWWPNVDVEGARLRPDPEEAPHPMLDVAGGR